MNDQPKLNRVMARASVALGRLDRLIANDALEEDVAQDIGILVEALIVCSDALMVREREGERS